MFIKRFKEWFGIKPKLDISKHAPPFFNQREVWWCYIGENIGSENSGKGEYFQRPVLVLIKLNESSFIGVPITSRIRDGSWFEKVAINSKYRCADLAQIRRFDYRRMNGFNGVVSEIDFRKIQDKLEKLLF